jgi:hypothetical protein
MSDEMMAEIREAIVQLIEAVDGYVDINDNGGPNNAMRLHMKLKEVVDEIDWMLDK